MKYLFYIGGLFFLQLIYSQEEKPLFHYIQNNKITELDTSDLYSFHEYRKDNEYLWLGNNGLANYSLIYKPLVNQYFLNSKLIGHFEGVSNKTYDVAQPFTSVKYVQGARTEQFFNVLHTQNFSKTGNFSIEYNKISAGGSYERQKANNNNIIGSFNYKTPNSFYKTKVFARRIKNTTEQNGGLENDSSFLYPSEFDLNRETLTINLDSASEQRIVNSIKWFQEFSIKNKIDTLGFGQKQNILLSSSFINAKRYYTDSEINTDFYSQILLDTLLTNDSLKLNQISNTLAYEIIAISPKLTFSFKPSVSYEYLDYRQASAHLFYEDIALGATVKLRNKQLNLSSDYKSFVSGYQRNNFNWNTSFSNSTKSLVWYLKANISSQNAAFDLQTYTGNHNYWNNDFIPTQSYNFKIGVDSNSWNLKANVNYKDIKNPIYFNYNQQPTQALDFTQIIKAEVEKDFKLKKWQLTPKVAYQYTGGAIVYRLPNYFASLKAGYGFKAFKKTLSVFTGVKITYYSEVQLMSYSPNLGQFYLANNGMVGNYPFVDFFVNTRIKNVRIFFALTHLNSGLTNDYNYFGAVNHPLEDRAYKVGINWNFLK